MDRRFHTVVMRLPVWLWIVVIITVVLAAWLNYQSGFPWALFPILLLGLFKILKILLALWTIHRELQSPEEQWVLKQNSRPLRMIFILTPFVLLAIGVIGVLLDQ